MSKQAFVSTVSVEISGYAVSQRCQPFNNADSETSKEKVLSEVSHGFGLRPEVKVVPGGTLPRFELKAKRFIKQD